MRNKCAAMILAAVLVFNATAVMADQEEEKAKIRLTGVRAVVGVVVPKNAHAGVLLGGALNMGTVWKPWMHLTVGATRWSTDIDSAAFSNRNGTLSDLRLYTNLGLEFWELSGVQGYFDVGVGAHFLDATIPNDPDLANAVGGTNIGAEVAFGLASTAGAFRVSAEARREFVDDANNWSFVLGIGTRWDKKKAEESK